MNKIKLIIVITTLLCGGGAVAQVRSDAPTQELSVERIKPFVDNSTIIIEGEMTVSPNFIYRRTDKNEDAGMCYVLIKFKPTAVFKGTTDTSKVYEILVQKGSYLCDPNGKKMYMPTWSEGFEFPPAKGIYFFPKEIKAPDFYTPSSNAIYLEYSEGEYGINYGKTNRTDAFKFLEEKFSLKPILVLPPAEEKKAQMKTK